MIHRDKGELVVECDTCGTEDYGGCQDDFRAFVEQIKAAGWRIKKDGQTWTHLCDSCAQEE